MCGIAGFISGTPMDADQLGALASRMADTMAHRGPDDRGAWVDAEAQVALGHRRLAVIDVSADGHQPMVSPSERFVVVYNGEIYNFRELRQELERSGRVFRTKSDTEVLLAAVEEWGVVEACRRFNGMFAFALWDRRDRVLHLARDRMGKKPLYYGWIDGSFLFASELKGLFPHPDFAPAVDREAVRAYLLFSYVPTPQCIYKGIAKLEPGSCLAVKPGGPVSASRSQQYWSVRDAAVAGQQDMAVAAEGELIAEVESLLRDAVGCRMIADVPIGALLSGGVDSSTVVALMQSHASRPVKTFTVGFHDKAYDEAAQARAVAEHLGTDHTELFVDAEEARAVIPRLPEIYDEPFADPSQIPTFLISRMARERVTVALTGDGGDEVFGGYNRYFWGSRIAKAVKWLPRWSRLGLASAVGAPPPVVWDKLASILRPVSPKSMQVRNPADKLQKLTEALTVRSPEELYRRLVTLWRNPPVALAADGRPGVQDSEAPGWPPGLEPIAGMMYLDQTGYLTDDILAKVDRASMGVSLEVRAPLLDYRVVELGWRLPPAMKVRGGTSKWVLRQVLYRYVPRELVDRPKTGFAPPIDSWLRGPLREWAEDLLQEGAMRREGYLDPVPIRRAWKDHLAGRRNEQDRLWGVLMFQAWLRANHGPVLPAGS